MMVLRRMRTQDLQTQEVVEIQASDSGLFIERTPTQCEHAADGVVLMSARNRVKLSGDDYDWLRGKKKLQPANRMTPVQHQRQATQHLLALAPKEEKEELPVQEWPVPDAAYGERETPPLRSPDEAFLC